MAKEQKEEEEKGDDLSKKMLETRTIVISDAVDGKLADRVIKQILLLEQMDPKKEIKLFINSPGGEVSSGFAIFDTLKFVTCPIATIVTGLAASMGSVLSMVGDEGRKFAMPHAKIMIHQPLLQGAQGNITDLEIHTEQILKTRAQLADMYARLTKKSAKQILKDMDRDNWMTAQEAMEYGLIDAIVTTRKDLKEK